MDSKLFSKVAVNLAARVPHPDKPKAEHQFLETAILARCVDLIIATATEAPKLADLPRRLNSTAVVLENNPTVEEVARAIKELAENFENYLQLIAKVKFRNRPELLEGSSTHSGYLKASLGSLLLGELSPLSPQESKPIKARIVTFGFDRSDLKSSVYNRIRTIRNDVHYAELMSFQVLSDVPTVLAAYLFATEENLKVIWSELDPLVKSAQELTNRFRTHLPFVVPLEAVEVEGAQRRFDIEGIEACISQPNIETFGIFGEPGAGKSTVMSELLLNQATKWAKGPGVYRFPVLIQASRFNRSTTFKQLIEFELGLKDGTLFEYADTTPLTLLIDGVNEVGTSLIREALSELRGLRQRLRSHPFVITSRFEQVFLGLGATSIRLLPFGDAQVHRFLVNALGANEAETFFEDLKRHPRLLLLCRNPLFLHMLTVVSGRELSIPRNRGTLLREFIQRYLAREEEQSDLVRGATLERMLSALAFEMRSRRVVALPQLDVEGIIERLLPRIQSGIGVIDVVQAAFGSRLLQFTGNDISFVHELFQEYFAARELQRSGSELQAKLPDFIRDRWWAEVIILYYGLIDDEDGAVYTAIGAENMSLAARCIMDASEPERARVDKLVFDASNALDHSHQPKSVAFAALAHVWTDSAINRIAEVLESKEQIVDFVSRFRTDPAPAAVDILCAAPSRLVASAVLQTLKTYKPDTVASIKLGAVLVELIGDRNGQVDFAQIVALTKFAIVAPDQHPKAVSRIRRLQEEGISNRILGDLAIRLNLLSRDPEFASDLTRRLVEESVAVGDLPKFSIEYREEDRRGLLIHALVLHRIDWVMKFLVSDDLKGLTTQALAIGAMAWLSSGTSPSIVARYLRAVAGEKTSECVFDHLIESRSLSIELAADSWPLTSSAVRAEARKYYMERSQERSDFADLAVQFCLGAPFGNLDSKSVISWAEQFAEQERYDAMLVLLKIGGQLEVRRDLVAKAESCLQTLELPDTTMRFGLGAFFPLWSAQTQKSLIQNALPGLNDVPEWWSSAAQSALQLELISQIEGRVPTASNTLFARFELAETVSALVAEVIADMLAENRVATAALEVERWQVKKEEISKVTTNGFHQLNVILKARLEFLLRNGDFLEAIALESWGDETIKAWVLGNERSGETIASAYDLGILDFSDVENWFVEAVQGDSINQALGVLKIGDRHDLTNSAVWLVLELLERQCYVNASQLIVAFKLADTFAPEVTDLVPDLLSSGRYGLVHPLLKAIGQERALEAGDIILRHAQEVANTGNLDGATNLLRATGMSFLQQHFFRWCEDRITEFSKTGEEAQFIRAVTRSTLVRQLGATAQEYLLKQVLTHGWRTQVLVKRVFLHRDFLFADAFGENVFLHQSNFRGDWHKITKGTYIEVRLCRERKGLVAKEAKSHQSQHFSGELQEDQSSFAGSDPNPRASIGDLREKWKGER